MQTNKLTTYPSQIQKIFEICCPVLPAWSTLSRNRVQWNWVCYTGKLQG